MSDPIDIPLSKEIKAANKINGNENLKEITHQKSAIQLNPGLKPPNLNKSQTQPSLLETNQYEGFQIRTNIVNDSTKFQKNKVAKEAFSNHNKSMSYLQIN